MDPTWVDVWNPIENGGCHSSRLCDRLPGRVSPKRCQIAQQKCQAKIMLLINFNPISLSTSFSGLYRWPEVRSSLVFDWHRVFLGGSNVIPNLRFGGTGCLGFMQNKKTLPETNSSPMKIPIFPGKYHQNGGFSMAMLDYRGVLLC